MEYLCYQQVDLRRSQDASSATLTSLIERLRPQSTSPIHIFQTVEDPSIYYLFATTSHPMPASSTSTGFASSIPLPRTTQLSSPISPFNAPVIAIARNFIHRNSVETMHELTERVHVPTIIDATKPWGIIYGWAVEDVQSKPDPEEGKEYFMVSAWESKEAHNEFRERVRAKSPEYASVRDYYVSMDVRHAVRIEL